MIQTLKSLLIITLLIAPLTASQNGCAPDQTSNDIQRQQQDKILAEGTAQIGMPAIKNFNERKHLKEIFELRDQEGIVTYTYLQSELSGKLVFFCNSIGYGIPYSTQFTAPETEQSYYVPNNNSSNRWGVERLPQADPNGLFSPADAEGTWVTCLGPDKQQHVVYVEPRVVVSPFPLATQ